MAVKITKTAAPTPNSSDSSLAKQPFTGLHDTVAAAHAYAANGFAPVPMHPKSKIPKVKDWPNYKCTAETIPKAFAGDCNIAILNGKPSGLTVDVDLDSPEANALAKYFLSPTACVFGRPSKPESHRLYRTIEAAKTSQWRGVASKGQTTLLELRSTGTVTNFPPSTHPSGEAIEFADGKAGVPSPISPAELSFELNLLAVATQVAMVWPKHPSNRHDLSLALAGGLLRDGVPASLVKKIIVSAATVAGDEEATARGDAVSSTEIKIKKGEKVTGWPSFAKLLGDVGDQVVKKCTAWLAAVGYANTSKAATTSALTLSTQLASEVNEEPIEWFWRSYLPFGALASIEGPPGITKSLLTCYLAAKLSAGGVLPDGSKCDTAPVLFINDEDSPETTIKPRLKIADADLDKVHLVRGVTAKDGAEFSFAIPDHLTPLRDKIDETKAKLVVIDPLPAYLSPTVNVNNDHEVRQALMPLKMIAYETGALILIVRHLNKQQGKPAIYRGAGSIGIIAAVRIGLIIGVDPSDDAIRILAVLKSNLSEKPPAWRYRVVSKTYMDGDKQIKTAAIEWLGTTNITADQLVSESVKKPTALNGAIQWLCEIFKNGPVTAAKVYELADAAGIAKITVQRASKKLGVKKVHQHVAGEKFEWVWSLPSVL